MNAREMSARVLARVLSSRRHLDSSLVEYSRTCTDPRERRLAQEICYGVMRWYYQLSYIAELLLDKPLKERDVDVLSLILVGLYQLKEMRTPDHAAISETVNATDAIGKPWARGLVNAVLRRYQREKTRLANDIKTNDAARFSHPGWLLERLRMEWPEHWEHIVQSNNSAPPLHLRVNASKTNREDYLNQLEALDIEFKLSRNCETGVSLTRPLAVEAIPGFTEGYASVQDFSAQLAAPLLDCHPGDRVLDACAGPGGKSTHLLEQTPALDKLVCVDISPERLMLVNRSMQRLGISAELVEADLTCSNGRWDNGSFDRILLDAPCSATGVIRRHPDIKFNREPAQLDKLGRTQQLLLCKLWPMLSPGGVLLYCTCSVLSCESDDQIGTFLGRNNNAELLQISADWGVKSQFGRHTIPGYDEGDGFYFAVLKKTPDQ